MNEQSKQWVEIVKISSEPKSLSGANLVHLGTRRVPRPQFQNSKAVNQGCQSVFTRIKPAITPAFNPALKGILSLHPSISRMRLDNNVSGPFASGLGLYEGSEYTQELNTGPASS